MAVGARNHIRYLVVVRQAQFKYDYVLLELRRYLAQCRGQYADRIHGVPLVYYGREVTEPPQELVRAEIRGDVLQKKQVVYVLTLGYLLLNGGEYLLLAHLLPFLLPPAVEAAGDGPGPEVELHRFA